MQPVSCYAVERRIIEHNDAVSTLRQPLECQQRVVRLYDNVADLFLIREHAVCLDQFLREPVVQFLEYEGAEA